MSLMPECSGRDAVWIIGSTFQISSPIIVRIICLALPWRDEYVFLIGSISSASLPLAPVISPTKIFCMATISATKASCAAIIFSKAARFSFFSNAGPLLFSGMTGVFFTRVTGLDPCSCHPFTVVQSTMKAPMLAIGS